MKNGGKFSNFFFCKDALLSLKHKKAKITLYKILALKCQSLEIDVLDQKKKNRKVDNFVFNLVL